MVQKNNRHSDALTPGENTSDKTALIRWGGSDEHRNREDDMPYTWHWCTMSSAFKKCNIEGGYLWKCTYRCNIGWCAKE